MRTVTYKVIEKFDPKKDYGIRIYPQLSKCLQILQTGYIFTPRQFVQEHTSDFTKNGKENKERVRDIITLSIRIGTQIGVLNKLQIFPIE